MHLHCAVSQAPLRKAQQQEKQEKKKQHVSQKDKDSCPVGPVPGERGQTGGQWGHRTSSWAKTVKVMLETLVEAQTGTKLVPVIYIYIYLTYTHMYIYIYAYVFIYVYIVCTYIHIFCIIVSDSYEKGVVFFSAIQSDTALD